MVNIKAQVTAKQRQIAELKLSGLDNKQIGEITYPNATPESRSVLISRELKKPHVAQYYSEVLAQTKELTITKYGVTWDKVLAPIMDALTATKISASYGESYDSGLPDHTTRMAASKRLQDLLMSGGSLPDQPPTANNINTELSKLISSGVGEVELHKAIVRINGEQDKA